jgi:hypothetical protein
VSSQFWPLRSIKPTRQQQQQQDGTRKKKETRRAQAPVNESESFDKRFNFFFSLVVYIFTQHDRGGSKVKSAGLADPIPKRKKTFFNQNEN